VGVFACLALATRLEGGDQYGPGLHRCQGQIHHILWLNFRAGARYGGSCGLAGSSSI
jgi:hypothetical protein